MLYKNHKLSLISPLFPLNFDKNPYFCGNPVFILIGDLVNFSCFFSSFPLLSRLLLGKTSKISSSKLLEILFEDLLDGGEMRFDGSLGMSLGTVGEFKESLDLDLNNFICFGVGKQELVMNFRLWILLKRSGALNILFSLK